MDILDIFGHFYLNYLSPLWGYFLCDGFSLGYEGPHNVKQYSPNLKLNNKTEEIVLWNKVMKEVKEGRYAGPFKTPHFDNFIQSPIGLVPKDKTDYHLIFHLSYPRSKVNLSVNANTPKDKCSVVYPDFAEAIQLCLQTGRSCKIACSDMKSAFCNLGILRQHWKFLVMKARSPVDGQWYYFVDKCLPFEAAISCTHFQCFSNAVAHLVKYWTGKPVINYLDDYLFVALLKLLCNQQVNVFLAICEQIRFPVSMEKTFWGATIMVFLGLLIDTVAQTVSIPVNKVLKVRNLITRVLNKRKLTLKELQQIWISELLGVLCCTR